MELEYNNKVDNMAPTLFWLIMQAVIKKFEILSNLAASLNFRHKVHKMHLWMHPMLSSITTLGSMLRMDYQFE